MLNRCQILVTSLVLGISVANLSACGQQGALYLPAETATAKHAPASAGSTAKSTPALSSKQP